MSTDSDQREAYLISRHLDGSLEESEMDELEALLLTSPTAATRLAEAARMHVALTQTCKQSDAEARLQRNEARQRQTPLKILLPLAAALIVVGLLTLWPGTSDSDKPLVMKTVGVTFADASAVAPGDQLSDKPIVITAGAVHLNYPGVAEVVIEAPARFQAGEGYQLLLHSGKLTANVIDDSSAFTVLTKDLEVIDRGTKFAVDAADDRVAEVHVFEGRVDARARATEPGLTSVLAGEAMHIDADGALVSRSFRSGSFLHATELALLAHGWDHRSHLRQWQAYSQSLETRPDLISYFQLEKHGDGRFVDYGSEVHGAKWVQGRWPGQYALDFSEVADHIDVQAEAHATRTVDELTMIAWARLDATPSGFNSLYHTHGWNKVGQVHWMVVNGNTMRLAIRDNHADPATSTDVYSTSTPLVFEFGQWVHLAVTYDRHAKTTKFYVNAEMTNEVRDEITHPAVVGPGQIGNWNSEPRKFGGRLDELLLLSKALSQAEVREHFVKSSPYLDASE